MDHRIAVLMTCFNRVDYTVKCLKQLFDISSDLDVYLVDDGSNDGTYKIISSNFPKIKILKGTGNLFWTRGMALAWSNASNLNYDFYLWLNNDVFLFNSAFKELFSVSSELDHKAIISGIVNDEKGYSIYGGYDANKKLIQSNGRINYISYLNGNVVLVPKHVFDLLGNFDPNFHHDLGDVDYGLSAIKFGIRVVTTRHPVSIGVQNNICRERMNNASLFTRFEKLYSPLGSPPSINFYFRKKHKSLINAIIYFMFQHFLNLIPDNLNNHLFGTKYQ